MIRLYSARNPDAGTPRGRDRDAWPTVASGGAADCTRCDQSSRSTLAVSERAGGAADRRRRARVPAAREIYPDAFVRRRLRTDPSPDVGANRADPRRPERIDVA